MDLFSEYVFLRTVSRGTIVELPPMTIAGHDLPLLRLETHHNHSEICRVD